MAAPRTFWTFTGGRQVAHEAQAKAQGIGLHVAMGGGVLHKGYSYKDLDLVVFRNDNRRAGPEDLALLARTLGWTIVKAHSFTAERHLVIALSDQGRVDLLAV